MDNFIDDEGYFFYVPERLICCSLEKHNAFVQATKEIEEMDRNGSSDER